MNKEPKLTLVGAGPGDPELITLKAINAIKSADVILYDALANHALLDYASANTIKIFVGKRVGLKKYSQEEINELIVKKALENGHVVRLKGGDPFIFGRGYEELEYARERGIEGLVVPGISSALAVPAYQQIPLTHRGASQSFWVITGTNRERKLTNDVRLAAQSTATVVILMGVHKLMEIATIYRLHRSFKTPVAIIQNGTLPEEKVVIGTLEDIEEKAEAANVTSPAIIVIGEVVNLAQAKSAAGQHAEVELLSKAV